MLGRALSPWAKMLSSTVTITAKRMVGFLLEVNESEHNGGQSSGAEPAHEKNRGPV